MTDASKMPPKVWLRIAGGGVRLPAGQTYQTLVGDSIECEGRTIYARSDLVEQMTRALEQCAAALQMLPDSERDIIKFTGRWTRYGSLRVSEILDRDEAALSAWEARE